MDLKHSKRSRVPLASDQDDYPQQYGAQALTRTLVFSQFPEKCGEKLHSQKHYKNRQKYSHRWMTTTVSGTEHLLELS